MSDYEQRYKRFGEYDKEADALYIRLTRAAVVRQLQVTPDIIADMTADERVVGVEVLCPAENLDRALRWLAGRGEHVAV